jgi:hypothetical protein
MKPELAPEVLLKETYNYIIDHPDEHNQGWWAIQDMDSTCGTAYCFAGTAVRLAHPEAEFIFEGRAAAAFVKISGHKFHVRELAEELLDLTPAQGSLLFDGDNTIHSIHHLLEDWKVL